MFRRKHHHSDDTKNELDEIQQKEKITELRSAIGPLSAHNTKFCTDECLRRYLVAQNWNLEKARKTLEGTLNWRSSYKPEDIRWNEISVESETGKMYRANFRDRDGRSVLVMAPAKQNTSSHDNQIKFLVYLLENAVLNLPQGQEQMVWLIDFTGWSLKNATPLKTAKETASILENYYPERLSAVFLYNPPRIFEMFWKVAKHFLDPITFQRTKFVYPKDEQSLELLQKYFDLDTLPEEFGGRNKVTYDHVEYSRMMVQDDENSANFWGSEKKLSQPNHLINENVISEATAASNISAEAI